jgi:hypothetical protein
MGAGYYRNMTLWNNGANPYGCTNYQNDLQIITSYNGFSYRADDYGSTVNNTAAKVNFTNNQFTLGGIIEKTDDIDVMKISVPKTGRFHLDAIPYNLGDGYTGANLDMQVELMTNASTVLNTYNPSTTLRASIDTTLNAGTYFLRVQGMGNAYAPEYASLGSYTLMGSLSSSITLPVHKLELRGSNKSNQHLLNWEIEADEAIVKQSLEVSFDGRNYQIIAQPPVDLRSYGYSPNNGTTLYYRLHVEFDNKEHHYSNVIALPVAAHARPALTTNLVRSTLSVNSPGLFEYHITDYSGRILAKGKLVQGTNLIASSGLSNGMYILQVSNGIEQYSEKFIKQ